MPRAVVTRAGRVRTAGILLRSVSATLRISVPTILDVFRGVHRRIDADTRLRWWSKHLLELIDLHYTVVDPQRFAPAQGRPTILMSNHQSLCDIPLVFVTLPGSIRMLTKKELFRVPIWGRALRAAEFVSIDRSDRAQAMRDLAEARRKMEDGIVLWVAPEGTRSRDGQLGPFKKGGFMLALETGATIVPIGIRGARDVLQAGTFRGLQLGCSAEVRVGAPIDAGAYSSTTREQLMADVQQSICELAAIEPRASTRPSA